MKWLERLHGRHVHPRRVRVLSERLAELIPMGARVLDVGCGDGLIAHFIGQKRPDVEVRGLDVLVRSETHIPVQPFDGRHLPCEAARPDIVMFIDVLHHTEDPLALLREGARLATKGLLIKDHTVDGLMAGPILRFMDQVGNARHGVAIPYNYWPKQRWLSSCGVLGLTATTWISDLNLYQWPADWIFGRSLHFLARFELNEPAGSIMKPMPSHAERPFIV